MKLIDNLTKKIKKYIIAYKTKQFFKKLWRAIYKTIFTFNLHSGAETAGNIAYLVIFAIFPFMIFFTIIIGYLGQTEIGTTLIEILTVSMPVDTVNTILPVIDSVINGPKVGILSIASLTLIWSASSLVDGLKSVLDRAYRIKSNKSYFLGRLMSILKFLLLTIFIIAGIFATIVFPKILNLINQYILPLDYNPDNLLTALKPYLLSIFLFIFIVSLYYIIPSKREKIKDIIWGSIITLIGWSITLKALTFYLQKMGQFQVVYGSLAGIIISLFFFYIMATILIFGAEFNYSIREEFGRR